MGIKMLTAYYEADGLVISIKQANKEMNGSLSCSEKPCVARVSYVSEHERGAYESSVIVKPFFRLVAHNRHLNSCKYNTRGKMLLIVRESDSEVLESLKNQKYEFRLHILQHSKKELAGDVPKTESESKTPAPQKNYINKGRLSAYLRTMNQIMELRSQIEGHEELGELVELDFRGTKIKWKNFYYENESEYEAAFKYLERLGYNAHPVCFQGQIRKVELPSEKFPHHSIRLKSPKAQKDAQGIKNIISVKFVIPDFELVMKLKEGENIVVYSRCRVSTSHIMERDGERLKFLDIKGYVDHSHQFHVMKQ
jgi:hypothetical protein